MTTELITSYVDRITTFATQEDFRQHLESEMAGEITEKMTLVICCDEKNISVFGFKDPISAKILPEHSDDFCIALRGFYDGDTEKTRRTIINFFKKNGFVIGKEQLDSSWGEDATILHPPLKQLMV